MYKAVSSFSFVFALISIPLETRYSIISTVSFKFDFALISIPLETRYSIISSELFGFKQAIFKAFSFHLFLH
ncbi:hypothetical protein M0811_11159 [Anaeramoeba ignava]|uniref:Uncharacterized protein n=1 Tax=Anaeramoeba ignava TaxID=1746090 RepID=A0A9Q0LF70_ANAIG|nr:hypothetical protein M0811_11159 [Anaeramoeba ignava]